MSHHPALKWVDAIEDVVNLALLSGSDVKGAVLKVPAAASWDLTTSELMLLEKCLKHAMTPPPRHALEGWLVEMRADPVLKLFRATPKRSRGTQPCQRRLVNSSAKT